MEEEKRDVDINDLVQIAFVGLNLGQLVFAQAVIVPELANVIRKYADALVELGD